MDDVRETAGKARQLSTSVYPRHAAMVEEIRMERAKLLRRIPKVSVVLQEAIEDLARREFDAEKFDELMAIS